MSGLEWTLLVVVAAVSVFVGAVGASAFRLSEASMHTVSTDDERTPPVHPEVLSVLTTMASIAVVVDEANRVLRADAQAYSLGFVRDDKLARPELVTLVDDVRRSGLTTQTDMELRRSPHSSDSPIFLEIRVAALHAGRVLILADDLSKERRLDATRRDFTANVSHELKTPIGAIQLLSETIADNADDPEAIRMFAPRLTRESHRLSALVQDIIDLSRLQEPDALIDARRVSIDDVVTDAVEVQRNIAEAADIDLFVALPCGASVWGSHDLLVTAVRNLIDNAIKYSEADSRVTVTATVDDDLVRVAVADAGAGLSADDQIRVFERFYRVDPGRSRNTGGTGLGLSIVKHVAADHGGTVSVWSRLGHGSTFTLVIPQASEDIEVEQEKNYDDDSDC